MVTAAWQEFIETRIGVYLGEERLFLASALGSEVGVLLEELRTQITTAYALEIAALRAEVEKLRRGDHNDDEEKVVQPGFAERRRRA